MPIIATAHQKWLLVPRQGDILTLTQIRMDSYINMRSVLPFQLFDYFVDAVIVRPPLISSIYSPAMPEGHLGKFFADSFHSSRWEADMIWILIYPGSRIQTSACRPALSLSVRTHTLFLRWKTNKVLDNDVWLLYWLCCGGLLWSQMTPTLRKSGLMNRWRFSKRNSSEVWV